MTVVVVEVIETEDRHSCREARRGVEEPGLSETEDELLTAGAELPAKVQILARAAEVGNLQTDLAQQLVAIAVAGAHHGLTGSPFLDDEVEIDVALFGIVAELRLDLHVLEEAQHVEPALALLREALLIDVARTQFQLAADNLLPRPRVAGDVDAANLVWLSLENLEANVDVVAAQILLRSHLGVEIALLVVGRLHQPGQLVAGHPVDLALLHVQLVGQLRIVE